MDLHQTPGKKPFTSLSLWNLGIKNAVDQTFLIATNLCKDTLNNF